jgi:hypothetical protein
MIADHPYNYALPSPLLVCLLRLEFGDITGELSSVLLFSLEMPSSLRGEDCNIDCLDGREEVVRGRRLFTTMLEMIEFAGEAVVGVVISSRELFRKGSTPPETKLVCEFSLGGNIAEDCEDRLLVGVGGIDWFEVIPGGVLDELARRRTLRFVPLFPSISNSSHDFISFPAISRTKIAVSISANRPMAS